jgi:hypothetical protein
LQDAASAGSTGLVMHGTDSLSAVKLVSRIRDTMGVDVPLSFMLSNPSVSELDDFIRTGGGHSGHSDARLVCVCGLIVS